MHLYVFFSLCLFTQAACAEMLVLQITLGGHFFPCSAHAICPYPPSHCLPREGRRTVVHSVSEFLCWRSSVGHCEGGVSSGSGLLLKLHSGCVDGSGIFITGEAHGTLCLTCLILLLLWCICTVMVLLPAWVCWVIIGYQKYRDLPVLLPLGPFARWDVAFKLLFEKTLW